MNTRSIVPFCLLALAGCRSPAVIETRYPPWATPSSLMADYLDWERYPPEERPDGYDMTPDQAADTLGLVQPVEVDDFCSVGARPPDGVQVYFSGGDAMQGIIHDADGQYVGIRIEENYPRADDAQRYRFYLNRYDGRGLGAVLLSGGRGRETEVQIKDPRLSAFAVLCRDWVSRKFTRKEAGDLGFSGNTSDQSSAGFLLWLFEPQGMGLLQGGTKQ